MSTETTQSAPKLVRALKLRDYARIDFRVSKATNEPYLLEVNPNPSLDVDAGFAAACAQAGYDFGGMLEKIIDAALA